MVSEPTPTTSPGRGTIEGGGSAVAGPAQTAARARALQAAISLLITRILYRPLTGKVPPGSGRRSPGGRPGRFSQADRAKLCGDGPAYAIASPADLRTLAG